ncbi:hypothetical protein Hypma_008151 [Hypsizygus marmoreus]|uniref:Retrotransposon gag domain-containing protein n=1 Tax=Hypsizygus marmoreus TaxID=39966 RepID=A0A369JTZ0_HYPMA|nr:hypothetical protein Hypma_008151 [Hypsizygus marmoreus]
MTDKSLLMATPMNTFKLPARGHSSALQFDGKPTALKRYFEDVTLLAKSGSLVGKEIIKIALQYVGPDKEDLWSPSAKEADENWDAFKKAITKLYPGAEDDQKYGITDLKRLSEEQSAIKMVTRANLRAYHQKFIHVASFL